MLSVHFVTVTLMSELPSGHPRHDSSWRPGGSGGGAIEEYRQLRQAMQEQQVNEEFDAARARWEPFPYGSPDLRRLRAGRYRVFYTIDEERIVDQIDHVTQRDLP
jgi:mRNA-degrading endonuclease RelE of RelBE toxin-antitoxin system